MVCDEIKDVDLSHGGKNGLRFPEVYGFISAEVDFYRR